MGFVGGSGRGRVLFADYSFFGPSDRRLAIRICLLVIVLLLSILAGVARAQISFSSTGLVGESLSNPTSLDGGPDDRLYVTQQNGSIFALDIQSDPPVG